MTADALMVSFSIIMTILLVVCCWPEGPRVEKECDEQVYGAVDDVTSCADLNEGRPCEVCRDETGDPMSDSQESTQIEHVDVDLTKVTGDRRIKGFKRG